MSGKPADFPPNDSGSTIRKAFFNLHGIRMRCVSTMALPLEQLGDRLRPYVVAPFSDPHLFVTLNVCDLATPYRIARMQKELNWVRSRPFWGQLLGDRLKLTDEASVATIDYPKRHVHFRLHPETLQDANFSARSFLLLPIIELLRTQGMYYLHASMVTKDSRAALFLGQGGSGKSTLAAALVLHGWKVVSDDNVLLRLKSNHEPEVFPLEQELSLAPAMASILAESFHPSSEKKKVRISLTEISHLAASWGRPTDLVFLHGPDHPTSTITLGSALTFLLQENPMVAAYPPLAAPHLQALRGLLQKVKLHTWGPPRITPSNLKDLGSSALQALDL